jgi:HD superfamily phosphodiesterase
MSPEYNPFNSQIVKDAKDHFLKIISEGTPIQPNFPQHVGKVKEWAERILLFCPDADPEILLLAVWLHDIGHADGKYKEDHAVKSEAEAIRFLSEKDYPKERIAQVAHCVRAHRCRDVEPETIEAKILVAADSASHMTDTVYITMLEQKHTTKQDILDKLERDLRDIKKYIPLEFNTEIQQYYTCWKDYITNFPK